MGEETKGVTAIGLMGARAGDGSFAVAQPRDIDHEQRMALFNALGSAQGKGGVLNAMVKFGKEADEIIGDQLSEELPDFVQGILADLKDRGIKLLKAPKPLDEDADDLKRMKYLDEEMYSK